MTYFDDFKALSQFRGENMSEQQKFLAQQAFDKYFNEAIDKVSGKIDGVDSEFIFQHLVYGERFNDEKLMVVTNDTDISIGSLVEWDGKFWICTNQENRAIPTHKVYKVNLCNNTISWKTSDGTVYTEPCFIKDEGLGQQDDSRKIPTSVSKRVVVIQCNDNTMNIYQNQRFVFTKKHVFSVTEIDDYTRPETIYQKGVISLKMERTQRMEFDDLPNNIAFNGDVGNIVTPTNGIVFSKENVVISKGMTDTIQVYEYVSGVAQPTTFTFRIDNIVASAYTIVSTTNNSITIKANQFFYVGNLVAIRQSTLVETTTSITLKSFI